MERNDTFDQYKAEIDRIFEELRQKTEDETTQKEQSQMLLVQDMLVQMKALTEEVKELRMYLNMQEKSVAELSDVQQVVAELEKLENEETVIAEDAEESDIIFLDIEAEKDDKDESLCDHETLATKAVPSKTIPASEESALIKNDSIEKEAVTLHAADEKKKPNKALSIISNLFFYVVIVAMVLGALLMRSTSEGKPFMLAGFSAANVLTSSMEDVYPRGSLIITKKYDAKELEIGDDITFMVSEDSSITHRIIGITENYQNTGQRGFETQGVNNPNPDKDMVAAANVVGKVIFTSKVLGDIANFVKANWPILIFVLVVLVGLVSFLKWNAKKSDDTQTEQLHNKKEKKSKKHRRKKKLQYRKDNKK